jgi:hypothetical protein
MASTNVIVVQSKLKRTSGVPADDVVNTWHFVVDSLATTASAQAMAERVRDFFIVNPTGEANNVFSQLGNQLASTGHQCVVYYLSDPSPRVPRYSLTFAGTPGTSAKPAEVAICVSYQGARTPGLPQSRNRGRVYIGPISATINTTGGDDRPHANTMQRFAKAATDLAAKTNATGGWVIYSPTLDALNPTGYAPQPVTDGWIDDAFDIQRRRGAKATTRLLWT